MSAQSEFCRRVGTQSCALWDVTRLFLRLGSEGSVKPLQSLRIWIMIALVDLGPNLAMAAGILLWGACIVFAIFRRKAVGGDKRPTWIPVAALFAGPSIALAWWAADVFVFNRDYLLPSDGWALLPPILIIGTFVGVISAVAFAVAVYLLPRSDD